jgi:hypothetical protein
MSVEAVSILSLVDVPTIILLEHSTIHLVAKSELRDYLITPMAEIILESEYIYYFFRTV